jgi:hypothetical protein
VRADDILYVEQALAPETCAAMRLFYDRYNARGSQRDYNGNRVIFYRDLPVGGRMALGLLAKLAHLKVLMWTKEVHFIESAFISKLGVGNCHEPHYDNVKPDGVTPNHTPQRSYSALFYLSGDFDGGEIVFEKQCRTIKPVEGSFIAFPSGAPYWHYVTPVTRGFRYAAPIWFTQSEKHVLMEASRAT